MSNEPFLKTVIEWDDASLTRFRAHGYTALNFQVQNGIVTVDFDLAPAKRAGLVAEVWGVTYGTGHPSYQPDAFVFQRDGKLLGQQAVKLGAQGVTMNAEMCAKFTRASRGLKPIIEGIREGGWQGPVSLNTLGAPVNPDVNDFEMDIESFLETGGGVAAQAYVNVHDEYAPELCARYWRRMGVPEGKLNLTLGLYDPRSENPAKRQLTGSEYVPLVQAANIGRAISIFRPETALPNDLSELEVITKAPAPPPPAPSTAETRAAIVAAAEAWEAGQGGSKPLTRITLAKRMNGPEIPDRRWKPVGEQIKAILDEAGA